MPGNVTPAPVTDVMPAGLMQQFSFERRYEALTNVYTDGSSTRATLSLFPRAYAKLARRLTLAQYLALRTFYLDHKVLPFYFYNLRETNPVGSWDPTGANPTGRYTMVFDAPWNETLLQGSIGYVRFEMSLREVH